ncbi:MAG: hypothetical protein ACK55I_51110, partial [bacterium]
PAHRVARPGPSPRARSTLHGTGQPAGGNPLLALAHGALHGLPVPRMGRDGARAPGAGAARGGLRP